METVINIKLWNENVAAVAWDKEREYATIEFYNTFANTGWNIAPLQMPINDILRGERIFSFPANRGKTFKGLPALLADSLPDDYGNSVIDEWFASKNRSVEISPLDRLCYIGKRGMGALEFEPANTDNLLNESSILEVKELTALAKEIIEQIVDIVSRWTTYANKCKIKPEFTKQIQENLLLLHRKNNY